MKRIGLFIFLLSMAFGSIDAQQLSISRKDFLTPYQKGMKLDIGVGANLDLSQSSANPAAAALGIRNTAATSLDLRFTHLFSRRIGWYAETRFKFFKLRNEYDSFSNKIGMALFEMFFGPLSKLHLAYDAGFVYRLESARWKCYPRIGVGASYYGTNTSKEKEKGNEVWKVKSNGDTFCLDLGVSTHYMIRYNTSLLLDISYQQPLNKATASLLHTKDGEVKEDYRFKSSTYGRELNISAGISVMF